ncbi:hypothetical protein [Synechocystis sp. PCC 7338]|uniref:hypothetical protein n=1 Tax=Synechocystis sp. PCC 7338 TaxID=2732530 RepID=UPI001BAFC316|nr:hypothetical protein [Synechocystis sp. PCC 7338]QUS62484.1 hypothetical protein HTZ78_17375 [Synechocystis sp. PCC 7338]
MKYKILPSLALTALGITAGTVCAFGIAPSAFANPTVGRETRTGDIYVSGGPICRNGATFTTADWPSP